MEGPERRQPERSPEPRRAEPPARQPEPRARPGYATGGAPPAAARRGDGVTDAPGEPSVFSPRVGKIASMVGIAAVVLAAGIALFGQGPAEETSARSFTQHVEPLEAEITRTNQQIVRHVNGFGQHSYTSEVGVGNVLQQETSRVRAALQSSGPSGAQAEFDRMQKVPAVRGDAQASGVRAQKPTLSPGMQQSLADGSSDLYQLYLYDNCAEDGDVVNVIIDGQLFATVPITHQGATLTVPVARGQSSQVVLEGVFDGGGGITVAFRSSEGDYFTRRMAVGEHQQVALVAR